MVSSSAGPADRFPGGAGEAEQERGPFLRHPQLCYHHMPQQSRLGKLRFPKEQNRAFSLSLDSTAPPRISRQAFGPFTGYAAVLGRSRFLEPARRLLEEVCQVGHQRRRAVGGGEVALGVNPADESPPPPPPASPVSRLDSMLDEVYRRYKQYYLQAQAVITSFESIAGLNNVAPFASMALDAMAKHFQCLRNIISDRLHQVNNSLDTEGITREPITSSMRSNSSGGYFHRPTKVVAAPFVWRPRRGLPEQAVAVLRGWLFEHFLHPYPTDVDKQNLAKQTGLTRNQVSNWFINARVRLWKPMVEEVHTLEMRKKSKRSQSNGSSSSSRQNDHIQKSSLSSTSSGHGNGVLLTLGLHRNDGVRFSESLLAVEDCSDGYLSSALGDHHPEQTVKVGGNRFVG